MAMIPELLRITESATPFTTMTRLSAYLTERPLGSVTQFMIRRFIQAFKINMDEVKEQDLAKYLTFNDFFTRELKPGARPVDQVCQAVSPVDGTIAQAGEVSFGRLIQAKGIDYSLLELVGGDSEDARPFEGRNFACIYLSPTNYHRIHIPLDGELRKTVYVPGRHFPVGTQNISSMKNLYTQNERLVCFFDTALGSFCTVFVAAALVGGIATPWAGTIVRRKGVGVQTFGAHERRFKRGEEIGMFKYGSTVICLWEKEKTAFAEGFATGCQIKMGQPMLRAGQ